MGVERYCGRNLWLVSGVFMSVNDTYKKIEEAIRPHLYKYEEPWLKRDEMINDIINVLYPGHDDIPEYGSLLHHADWRDEEILRLREEYDRKNKNVDHGIDIIGDEHT